MIRKKNYIKWTTLSNDESSQRQFSISRILGQELTRIVHEAEQYELAKNAALANLKEGFHLGREINTSREELHER